MDYIKEYGLTSDDINEILGFISEEDKANYYVNEMEVRKILDYFKEIGIINIKDILKYKTNIFYQRVEDIKEDIKDNQILIELINEDVMNFDRIGY